MSISVRMSQTSSVERPFITFDLAVEGLTHFQARNLYSHMNDLVLGPVTDESGNRPSVNPLAALDGDAQKYVAIIVRLYYIRFDSGRITGIRMLRSLYPGLGLKDAKDFVDYALTCEINSDRNVSPNFTAEPQPWIKF